MNEKNKVLGRGLASLFEITETKNSESYVMLKTIDISPSPYQARKIFKNEELEELASSISEKGVLQPILVRKTTKDRYQLIAGERRLKAAEKAGLDFIPCRLLEINSQEALEIGLLENIQRSNLNCLEEAKGYEQLIEHFSYTQEMIAKKIGKSRSHIANLLRLLNLPTEVKKMLDSEKITSGHAKVILGAANPIAFAEKIIKNQMSVRRSELFLKKQQKKKKKTESKELHKEEIEILSQKITKLTGFKIEAFLEKDGAVLKFFFDSHKDLDVFLQKITDTF